MIAGTASVSAVLTMMSRNGQVLRILTWSMNTQCTRPRPCPPRPFSLLTALRPVLSSSTKKEARHLPLVFLERLLVVLESSLPGQFGRPGFGRLGPPGRFRDGLRPFLDAALSRAAA